MRRAALRRTASYASYERTVGWAASTRTFSSRKVCSIYRSRGAAMLLQTARQHRFAGRRAFLCSAVEDKVENLRKKLFQQKIVLLSGAGISTDSGIPDYRSPGRPPHKPVRIACFNHGSILTLSPSLLHLFPAPPPHTATTTITSTTTRHLQHGCSCSHTRRQ